MHFLPAVCALTEAAVLTPYHTEIKTIWDFVASEAQLKATWCDHVTQHTLLFCEFSQQMSVYHIWCCGCIQTRAHLFRPTLTVCSDSVEAETVGFQLFHTKHWFSQVSTWHPFSQFKSERIVTADVEPARININEAEFKTVKVTIHDRNSEREDVELQRFLFERGANADIYLHHLHVHTSSYQLSDIACGTRRL